MQPVPGYGTPFPQGEADRMKQAGGLRPKGVSEDKVTTVFVGGLRKSTSEDKVAAHFAKYGQVDSVDIKRLPDGTSRGFAFVKFTDKESVDKAVEAKANHMIDNKWVAVRPHGGSAFQAAQHAEREKMQVVREKEKKEAEAPSMEDDYEEKWSEKYLLQAASLRGTDEDGEDGKDKDSGQMNPMMAMMMNPMMAMMMGQMACPQMAAVAEEPLKEGLVESLQPKEKRKGRGKGKLAPNAEHCQMPIDPQVEALCQTFNIEDRIMRRLNDVMLTREGSFDSDMKALWEVCENAQKPSGFLMVKIGELERGCFTGAGKLDQAMLQFRNRWRLDDRALAKFVEVVHPRDQKTEDMAQLDRLLKGAQNPSQAIMPMLNHLRSVGDLDDLIREQRSNARDRDREKDRKARYSSKSRSRSRSRRRR